LHPAGPNNLRRAMRRWSSAAARRGPTTRYDASMYREAGSPVTTRWEYNVTFTRMVRSEEDAQALRRFLNAQGSEGWELVSSAENQHSATMTLMMKRQVP